MTVRSLIIKLSEAVTVTVETISVAKHFYGRIQMLLAIATYPVDSALLIITVSMIFTDDMTVSATVNIALLFLSMR